MTGRINRLIRPYAYPFALTRQVSRLLWEAFLVVWKASLTQCMGLQVDYTTGYDLV